ncbi:unnamed protein product [Psylliodes chrysocephalus]|uniref:Uncharacterized protein n=1 Tax=Psylliodes chrysocephalus TaxID=3402493 RepID=A0A9P0CR38_9CUCU|nr:unnamed protein product [Psylliodes chrysocephala]
MKVLIISLAIACFAAITALPAVELEQNEQFHDIITNIINGTLNKIIKNLSDPMTIKDMNLSFNKPGMISGGLKASDIQISGIKSLIATVLKIDFKTHTIVITLQVIDSIFAKLNYMIDLLVADLVPLYGEGLGSIDFTGLQLDIAGGISTKSLTNITVSDLQVLVTLKTATFNLNGLLNNPEFSALVNTALNDNFVTLVNENNKLLSSILGPIVTGIINGALHKH